MDGPIDLTDYTELAAGYDNLDPSQVSVQIGIEFSWDMPATADYVVLTDPNSPDFEDNFRDPLMQIYTGMTYAEALALYPDEIDWADDLCLINNRVVTQADPTTVYDFQVGVTVQ